MQSNRFFNTQKKPVNPEYTIAYPGGFDIDTRRAILAYLTDNPTLTALTKGCYELATGETFTLSYPIKIFGSLGEVGVDAENREQERWFQQYLLHSKFENYIFDTGLHVLPYFNQQDLVAGYFTFTAPNKFVIRRDKYDNLVCDLIESDELGIGYCGVVRPIFGSIKIRAGEANGVATFEQGFLRRAVKLYKDLRDSEGERLHTTDVMMKSLQDEITLTKTNLNLSVRNGFRGSQNNGDRTAGFSCRYVSGQELFDVILDDFDGIKIIPSLEKIKLIIAILKAIKSDAHDYGVVHADISPQNIMIDKINGAWSARVLDYANSGRNEIVRDVVMGTMPYLAPEGSNKLHWTKASDVFSIAAIIAVLLHDPHQIDITGRSPDEILNIRGKYNWNIPLTDLFGKKRHHDIPAKIKSRIRDTLQSMLNRNPDQRPSIETCISLFDSIYQQFHDEWHDEPSCILIQCARTTAAAFVAAIAKTRGDLTKDLANDLIAELSTIIKDLPDNGVAFQEFIRCIDCKFAYGITSKKQLLAQMRNIVNGYFIGLELVTKIHEHLRNLCQRDITMDQLTKATSNLNQFLYAIKLKTPLNLDKMDEQIPHLQSKYRKMLHDKKYFDSCFAKADDDKTVATKSPMRK